MKVTSLADSGPGSLREAIAHGNRRIVFGVGGTIRLKSKLTVSQSGITLDGSSAPAPGVTVTQFPFVIEDVNDVVVQHLRFRDSMDDTIRVVGKCRNIVIDHCSATNAKDGAIDITRGVSDITVSWCLLANTDKAMLIDDVSNLSIHHCLFTQNGQRHPQVHNVRNFDVRNNVIRQWRVYGIRARANSFGNIVNNVFGLSSNPGKPLDRALLIVGEDAGSAASGRIHITGNLGPKNLNLNLLSTTPKPYPTAEVSTLETAKVLRSVIEGCSARPLDTTDRTILNTSSGN